MDSALDLLAAYHRSGGPLSCEIDVEPWTCEFWPIDKVEQHNSAYEVSICAPGYLGFASSGGGEMYAISPTGAVVCMAFVGMSPRQALPIANSWQAFEEMLRCSMSSGDRRRRP
jgi:hypothetical protein